MNRLFLSLLLLTAAALAGDRPKGFLNINWGASPEEAKRILQARPGIKFPEETDDYKFELTGGEFAGKPVAKWVLEFPDRKFASATVVLKNEGDAPGLYKEFRTNLVGKYGPATSDRKVGPKTPKNRPGGPPADPSAQSTTATWKFTPNIKEKSAVSIVCEMGGAGAGGGNGGGPGGAVTLRYVNDTLVAASAPKTENAKPAGPVGVKKDEL
jgi:hypothetical protein